MGAMTPNGLPYPTGGDLIMDGDNAMEALARAVDTKALLTGDSGVVSGASQGFAAHTNFNSLGGNVQRRNGLVVVGLDFRTALAQNAGNVGNVACIVIPSGWRPKVRTGIGSGSIGPVCVFSVDPNGYIYLCATASAISANGQLSATGMWMV
jgi:hypothetical protein